jgi:hypothetical protein
VMDDRIYFIGSTRCKEKEQGKREEFSHGKQVTPRFI